ncbi:MAG: hypothetical protein ACYSR5_10615, partial [Planctomycetota bacterium]
IHLPIDFPELPAHNTTMTKSHPNTLAQQDLPAKSSKSAPSFILLGSYSRPKPKSPENNAHNPCLTNNLQQPQTQVQK